MGTHSKNVDVYGKGYDLTPFIRSGSMKGSRSTAEKSALGDIAHSFDGGLQAGEFSASGRYSDGTGEIQRRAEAMLGTAGQNLIVIPAGDALGADAMALMGTTIKHDVSIPAEDMVDISIDAMSTVGVDLGRVLWPLSATTTATNSVTAVDTGAAWTNGAAGYIVCTATTSATITVTIQDSADGAAGWADIMTFTAITGANTEQRVTCSGVVRRYLRAAWTGTITSTTFHVSAYPFAA